MRRLVLVFLMICLPLQWAGAAVACCVDASRATQTAPQHQMAQMDGEHHHHDHASSTPEKPGKHGCDGKCTDCHAHGIFVPATESVLADFPALPVGQSVYLSSLSSTVPEGLFRPPLVGLI